MTLKVKSAGFFLHCLSLPLLLFNRLSCSSWFSSPTTQRAGVRCSSLLFFFLLAQKNFARFTGALWPSTTGILIFGLSPRQTLSAQEICLFFCTISWANTKDRIGEVFRCFPTASSTDRTWISQLRGNELFHSYLLVISIPRISPRSLFPFTFSHVSILRLSIYIKSPNWNTSRRVKLLWLRV